MKWIAVVAMLGASVGVAGQAEAKGCIKGAIVGGVAGHFAGHHGVMGAMAGCAVGHHYANKKPKDTAPGTATDPTPPAQ